MHTQSMTNPEILDLAKAVSRQRGVDEEIVVQALKNAIRAASRAKYGQKYDIDITIDRQTGSIRLFRTLSVVEEINNIDREITADAAQRIQPGAVIGDVVYEPLPPLDLVRTAAGAAMHVMKKEIENAVRENQYQEFLPLQGSIVSVVVSRIENQHVIGTIGGDKSTEAILRHHHKIPHETFRMGDRIKALLQEVRRTETGPQLFLSRTHGDFMARLFAQEVPEIYDGLIDIRGIAREPGSRAKVAVFASDPNIDPVGSCVGVRGSRVQAVTNELHGEKIDIVPWSADSATYVVNALAPAEVSRVIIDEEKHAIEVVVATDQLSIAIGRRGQNVRLAAQLCRWNIDILTEEEETKRRTQEFTQASEHFMRALDVEEVLAHLIVVEGFRTAEELANTPIEALTNIEGFDEDLAAALLDRARQYVASHPEAACEEASEDARDEEGIDHDATEDVPTPPAEAGPGSAPLARE